MMKLDGILDSNISITRMHLRSHFGVLREWLSHPRASAWGLVGSTDEKIYAYLEEIDTDPDQDAWVGFLGDQPKFMVETYSPRTRVIHHVFQASDTDLGMHLLVAPPTEPVHGLTSAIMRSVVSFCFGKLGAERIIVEPDANNEQILRKNAEVGFRVHKYVSLTEKLAAVSILDKSAMTIREAAVGEAYDDGVYPHLEPSNLELANRRLLAKGISEFAHERLISPSVGYEGSFSLAAGEAVYTFSGVKLSLDHLDVDPYSIQRRVSGALTSLDAQQFILDLRESLRIPDDLFLTYLQEVSSTLTGLSFRLRRSGATADSLVGAGHQEIESSMIDGHPCFFANGGRVGFGLNEFLSYAPESGSAFQLIWLAASTKKTELSLSAGRSREDHINDIGPETVDFFQALLRRKGLDPNAFDLVPVHPWQWDHHISTSFSSDLGRGDLVYLGQHGDFYVPQQSIRTLANSSDPMRPFVKGALSIQNMGFRRGLSPEYMRITPAISDWIADKVRSDEFLSALGFDVLKEFASVGYTGDIYRRVAPGMPETKMVAALWRESASARIAPNERLVTMAALLHRDRTGKSFITSLIWNSTASTSEWVQKYLSVYLLPLLRCLDRHDLAFMPHGENVLLVLDEDGNPAGVFLKDLGEEVAVLSSDVALPASLARIRQAVPPDERALAIFTDVFDGFFRHFAAILHVDGFLDQTVFWQLVSSTIETYVENSPDFANRYDLRAPLFAHSCLNRLQLRNTISMVDLSDQASSLIFAGTMVNPVGRANAS